MNINNIPVSSSDVQPVTYKIVGKKGRLNNVHPDHNNEAAIIDQDKDTLLTDTEIKKHLRKEDILRDPRFAQVDEKSILRDYKLTLQNKELEQIPAYHSYEELTTELHALAEKYPGIADLQSLGKSAEGRDIWALKITKKPETSPENPAEPGNVEKDDPNWLITNDKLNNPQQTPQQPEVKEKPGIVITGLHHAREHITLEVPLFAAKQILEGYGTDPAMTKRVDETAIWVVPMVNPDGYEYSRTQSFWWRKNRQPITDADLQAQGNISNLPGGVGTSEKGDVKGIGIDLNRNYMDDDPANFKIYRPEGDTPGSTWDDDGASDRISSDTYRGPAGSYAPEVKVLEDLEQNNNIKGAMDFHSYGRMILYPWGYKYGECEKDEEFSKVAQNMAEIIRSADDEGVSYRPMQSSDLYPATGSSEDFQYVNGILGITVELGRTFAPDEKDILPICKRLYGAQLYLIDHIMEKENQSQNPPQAPPQNPANA